MFPSVVVATFTASKYSVLEGSPLSQGTHPPLFVSLALSPLPAVAMCRNSRTSPLLLRQGQALPTWDKRGARLCPGDYFLRLGVGGL